MTHLYGKEWLVEGNPNICSIEMDSRKVTKQSLFICIRGFTVDGHDYVQEALNNGAVALIVERPVQVDIPTILVKDSQRAMAIIADAFYGSPTHDLHLIGVTGTNGKTTTTYLIDKILTDNGHKTGRIGTINTKINEREFANVNTTPESLSLQQMFYEMVKGGTTAAVMEVSSHALDLGRVRGLDFDIALFTNLTQDHLDYHGTMENYKQAKGLLFSQLGNTYDKNRKKMVILNKDDRVSSYFMKITAAEIMSYAIHQHADVCAKHIQMTSRGTNFVMSTPYGETDIHMQMVGTFSVYNALAATAACLASGVPLTKIKTSLESIEGVPGRFEVIDENQPFTVLVDYAHTPDSLLNILKTVKGFAEQQIILVVGCGGDRDKMKRPIMGEIAVKYATKTIFTSDNPRSEDPEQILMDITEGLQGNYVSIIDRKEAIERAIKEAKEGDVVIIAGKGHETEQIIGNKVYEFDDREVARAALKELS